MARTEHTKDAFLDTLMHLQPALQLVAERLLRSAAEAEDTVQEVVVDLWEMREKLRHVKNIEGYAMRSLQNRCRSVLRRQRMLTADDLEACVDISDEEAMAEAALTQERAARLDRALAQLPERQREAIQMRYIDQLSHEEMQRRLGMSSTNVYATLSRAVSTLKLLCQQ